MDEKQRLFAEEAEEKTLPVPGDAPAAAEAEGNLPKPEIPQPPPASPQQAEKERRKAKLRATGHKDYRRIFRDNAIFAMPILSGGLGICLPVLAVTTVRSGLALSLIFFFLILPVCVLSSLCFRYLPRALRILAATLTATVFYAGALFLAQGLFPLTTNLYQVYAPLLVVSSLLLSRGGETAVRQNIKTALIDSFSCSIGFALVCVLLGGVREFLSDGTLMDYPVWKEIVGNRMAVAPFFGIIVLGFIAALAKRIRNNAQNLRKARKRKEHS